MVSGGSERSTRLAAPRASLPRGQHLVEAAPEREQAAVERNAPQLFGTDSQSLRKVSRPLSVKGCLWSCQNTFGGSVATCTGSLGDFLLGGRRFEAPRASFALEDKGAFADDYVLGNIGGKFLEPFLLVFDYPSRRLGFVPR